MTRKRHPSQIFIPVEAWELGLISKVASAFRAPDREELEAELAKKLCELKSSKSTQIRDWKGYVAKFLYNKAANYVRDQRVRDMKSVSLEKSGLDEAGETTVLEHVLASRELEADTRLGFSRLWESLDLDLRRAWELLIEERGNQAEVARKLGKHRNTVRLWIQEIQRALKEHGF